VRYFSFPSILFPVARDGGDSPATLEPFSRAKFARACARFALSLIYDRNSEIPPKKFLRVSAHLARECSCWLRVREDPKFNHPSPWMLAIHCDYTYSVRNARRTRAFLFKLPTSKDSRPSSFLSSLAAKLPLNSAWHSATRCDITRKQPWTDLW